MFEYEFCGMSMLTEFKTFAQKGNVLDMAIGVILGGAFGLIVNSLVNDILTPPIGMFLDNVDFKHLKITLVPKVGEHAGVFISYGMFLQTIINFTIIAFCLFMIIKFINQLKAPEPTPESTPAEPGRRETFDRNKRFIEVKIAFVYPRKETNQRIEFVD